MLSDLTDPEAVRKAAAEYDKIGKDAFLRRYGYRPALRLFARIGDRHYDSKALVGAAYGVQYPERGPLSSDQFSGGEATVRPTLERLGFEVVDRRSQVMESMTSVQEAFGAVLDLIHEREEASPEFDPGALSALIRQVLPGLLAGVVEDRAVIRGRTGIGTPADVPWVGLFSSDDSASAQQGFYLVYLFAKDGSSAYLSLNQGTEEVKGGVQVLQKRALDLQRATGAPLDLKIDVDLRSSTTRPRKYEAGSALAVRYERGQIPPDDQMKADLSRMLDLRDEAVAIGVRWDPSYEPIHLVFKWNDQTEPKTLDLHREIAEREGAVWWGRFSSSPTPSIAAAKLAALQNQLAAGVPTRAYLYHRGVLWVTTVQEVTVVPPTTDDPRFPEYYKPSDCNLFTLLSEFRELPKDYLPANVVLASQPDSDPNRMTSALSNQTTPLFVFELQGAATTKLKGEPGLEGSEPTDDLKSVSLADVCQHISENLRTAGLSFGPSHSEFVRSAVVSLITKRFLLLTGLSGSGKTRLGIGIGEWFGLDRLDVVPVRPDWTGPEALFGFENGLSPLKAGRHAWTMTRSLQFMLRAISDPKNPYLLLLDEMNLAHVERYFADALSGMESGSSVVPHVKRVGDEWRLQEPALLPFPSNLFIVGTVNIDETTYMFSPKVLDRANTLEFRVRTEDLQIGSTPISPVEPGPQALVRRFVVTATTVAEDDDWSDKSQLGEWLQKLHRVLAEYDREFGHRVFLEALRFGALLADAGVSDPVKALDLQVLQKVLPKVHGSIRQVADLLNVVGSWCWYGPDGSAVSASFDPLNPPSGTGALPLSFEKVQRMVRRLRTSHFVSFAE